MRSSVAAGRRRRIPGCSRRCPPAVQGPSPTGWPDVVERVALAAVAMAATLTFLLLPVVDRHPDVVLERGVAALSSAGARVALVPGLPLRCRWRQAAANSLIVGGRVEPHGGCVRDARGVSARSGALPRTTGSGGALRRPARSSRPSIAAVALYIAFAKVGLLGSYRGLILAHTVHSVPYVVLLMSVAIASFDERIEQVARTLGAPERTVFGRILLPN